MLTTEWVLLLQATSSSNKINDVESVAVTEISIFPPYSKAIHPRGPMRRTVRPFIKEFKRRSLKSSAACPPPIDDADKNDPKSSFLDLGVFSTPQNSPNAECDAALKMAETVFGGRNLAAAVSENDPSSSPPVGRVLPSLIQEDDALTVRLREADEKTRRGSGAGKAMSPSPIRRKKPILQPESETATVSVERPSANLSQEISFVSAPDRERRSIQKRWVLGTELKAGERWKRRLCNAAR